MAHFDLLVIGGGQAGIPLAHEFAKTGRTVALAERKHLGGSCVNFGCNPTKAALASAKLAQQAKRAAEYGLYVPHVNVDFDAVLERADRISTTNRQQLEQRFHEGGNPRLFHGHARLTGRAGAHFTFVVNGEPHTAALVVLNTGTRTLVPAIEGLDECGYIDAGNWKFHRELPIDLAIVGASYVGVEMAQFYRRMGSAVTVVAPEGQILPDEDQEIAAALQRLLEREGIRFQLRTRIHRIERADGFLTLHCDCDGPVTVQATDVFLATGRRPNTDDLGLDTAGVAVDERGIVQVDERLATTVPGIYAAGDIRGGPMFTHTAWDDYRILLSQLLGDKRRTTQRIVPYAVHTDPELGRVGLTERQAQAQGIAYQTGYYEVARNGKAQDRGEADGVVKVLTDAAGERLLGAAILAPDASEVIHSYVALMNAGAPVSAIAEGLSVHPTISEAAQSVLRRL